MSNDSGSVYLTLAREYGIVCYGKRYLYGIAEEVTEMARRLGAPTYGRRYVGNTSKREVHDLDNEDTRPNGCQIDEIIRAGHARIFDPDTLAQAHAEGYDNGANCVGGSLR